VERDNSSNSNEGKHKNCDGRLCAVVALGLGLNKWMIKSRVLTLVPANEALGFVGRQG
jgi:hypothetical protein